MKIILASASPRRKALLEQIGMTFEICPANCDETLAFIAKPSHAVMLLARRKAFACRKDHPESIIIGADTVVSFQGQVFGKPKNEKDAYAMLNALSGRTHQVFTGVCIAASEKTQTFFVKTDVTFYPLTDQIIRDYIATKEPMDKAGAYGIQGKGALLVQSVKGDYNNIVGLPVSELARRLTMDF